MMYRTALINGCIKVEDAVASIYSSFMQIFPENKDFWNSLFQDEKEHVAFLNDVKASALTEEIEKLDLLPTMPMIDKTLRLAEAVTEKIKHGSLSFYDALSMTLEIEESMVETYTNRIVTKLLSCASELSCEEFITDEKEHVEKIKSMMTAV